MRHALSALLAVVLLAGATSVRAEAWDDCTTIVGAMKSIQQRIETSREDLEIISSEYLANRAKGYAEDILDFGRSRAARTRDRMIGEGRRFEDFLEDARAKKCLPENELVAHNARTERLFSEGLLHYRAMTTEGRPRS